METAGGTDRPRCGGRWRRDSGKVVGERMRKLKVGILGCGKMGRVYAHWFACNSRCEVVAFYNRTYSRAEELANLYAGSAAKADWREITGDADIDIIGICTPSHEHAEQMAGAAEAGKHVLCEKPMARNGAECREMCNLTANLPIKVAVGFQMRLHPVIRKVDELIGRIGPLFHIDFVFGMYRPEITWRHQGLQQGGVLKELGSHLLDLATHWMGHASAITAQNRIISPPREVEDYSLNLLEFAGGATGYLSCNYFDRRGRVIQGNLIGEGGQISWQFSSYDPADSRVVLYGDSDAERIALDMPSADRIDNVYPGHLDSFAREIDGFVDCIVNDTQPLAGAVEGAKAIELVDASYESTKSGKRIDVALQK